MRSTSTYRRRRIGVLLAAAMTCALYAGSRTNASQPPDAYTVRPGDTLWKIATRRCSYSEDPRPLIEEIRAMNGMKGYGIRPGRRLELPASR